MKDCLLIVAFIGLVYAALSWASAPALVFAANQRADSLQAQVYAQATTIASIRPTPNPCRLSQGYPVC